MATDVTCLQCGKPYNSSLVENQFAGVCPACLARFAAGDSGSDAGSVPFEKPPLKVGGTFHGLEIVELLGSGGMGVVYKARQVGLDRFVALKVLSPKLSSDPEFLARFNREARAMAALSHPGIVQVFDYGKEADLCFLVMEFVEGISLRQLMNEGRLPPEKALAIVPQLCEALQFAHGRGVIHRDIKPENILLTGEGRVKIADFGLARVLDAGGDARVTITNVVMGTPGYMAPEQYHSMKVDHRADIYSLGVVFYEMLTGALPVGPFDPPSKRVQIDFRLDDVVLKSLEREPERRYQQASEVKTDLDAVASQGGAPEGYCDAGEARNLLDVDVHGLGKLIENGRVRAYPFKGGFRFRRDELAGMAAFVGDHSVRRQGRLAFAAVMGLFLVGLARQAEQEFAGVPALAKAAQVAMPVFVLISMLLAAGALTATAIWKGRILPKLIATGVLCLGSIILVLLVIWATSGDRGPNVLRDFAGQASPSKTGMRMFGDFAGVVSEQPPSDWFSGGGISGVASGMSSGDGRVEADDAQSVREYVKRVGFRDTAARHIAAFSIRDHQEKDSDVQVVIWFAEVDTRSDPASVAAMKTALPGEVIMRSGRFLMGIHTPQHPRGEEFVKRVIQYYSDEITRVERAGGR